MSHPPVDLTHEDLARELRAAVLGSDHAKAARVSEQYTYALGRQWALMSETERAVSGIPRQAVELLTWAREVMIMHHAMAAQHLSAIQKASRYLSARANYLRTATLEAQG